ncbi:MAG TPA: hypothetical protein VFZ66_04730 [Herpetosiphonaceae bacterium]
MRQLMNLMVLLLLMVSPLVVAAQSGPQLKVTAPASEAAINGTNVMVEFQATGITLVPSTVPLNEAGKRPDANRAGEGHLHLMLDLQPLIVWERAEPYRFENVPPGEHQLMVELVNNDHSPLSPPVVQQIRFRTAMMMPATGTGRWQINAAYVLLAVFALLALSAGLIVRRRSMPRTR